MEVWVMIATAYATVMVPAFSGPDFVNFIPRTVQVRTSSKEECARAGREFVLSNVTRPYRGHAPQASFQCVKSVVTEAQ